MKRIATRKIVEILLVVVLLLPLASCNAWSKVDELMQNFNQHTEGFLTLFGIIGTLTGAIAWLISYVRKRTEILKNGTVKKNPIASLIGGYSLFNQLNWDEAVKSAEDIAQKLLRGKDSYDPTIIVCIGRGGAIYGSLLSYSLSELPILALDRLYTFDDQNNRTQQPMYPFRIPKAFLKRVLLVAGESHTRKTLLIFNEKLKAMGAGEIRNCVFYNQIMPATVDCADIEIRYSGVTGSKDYLMPWQNRYSMHPSENKEHAEAQNRLVGRYISKEENRFAEDGFYCMRHAETPANSNDCFIGSGSPDVKLSPQGISQAKAVGQYFKRIGVQFDEIYCSPLKRCYQTAMEITLETGGGIIIPQEELLEFNYGKWEGEARVDIEKNYPKEYHEYLNSKDGLFCPPGGTETLDDVRQRLEKFINGPLSSQVRSGKKVLVITHKTIGRILYQQINTGGIAGFREIPMNNASIGYVSLQDEKMKVILDNKTV